MKKLSITLALTAVSVLLYTATAAANPGAPSTASVSVFDQQVRQWSGLYCVPSDYSDANKQAQDQKNKIAKQLQALDSSETPQGMALYQKYFSLESQYDTCTPLQS